MPINNTTPVLSDASMPVLTMRYGGKIKKDGGGRPSKKELKQDTVPAILQIGEIVIPRKIATNNTVLKTLSRFGYNRRSGRFQ
jgi:hypothetical protein